MRIQVALLLLLVSSTLSAPAKERDQFYSDLVNSDVTRNIDLTGQNTKITNDVLLHNKGSQSVSRFFVAVPSSSVPNLALLRVTDEANNVLAVEPVETVSGLNQKNAAFFRVRLVKTLEAGQKAKVAVTTILTHLMTPFPTHVAQGETQLVKVAFGVHFFSPYTTATQKTVVKLPSTKIERQTEKLKGSIRGDTVTFGPYQDTAAFSEEQTALHFENNKPLYAFTYAQREVEVSHWGNVAVEEQYELVNTGATLKGAFSRLEYMRNPHHGAAAVKSLRANFPRPSWGLYYRDVIGNVSTSHARRERTERMSVEISPRFPVLGGWKTQWTQGYNVPTRYSLYTDGSSRFLLNVSFALPFEGSYVADELTVKIVLPEGATDIKVVTPHPVDSESRATKFTYLDITGRPVVVLTKRNLVDEHKGSIQVAYTFTTASVLREPLMLIGGFFSFFVLAMVYVRFELTIAKEGDSAEKDVRARAAFLANEVFKLNRSVQDSSAEFNASLDLLKKGLREGYDKAKKSFENETEAAIEDMSKICEEVEELDAAAAAKVRVVVAQARLYKGAVQSIHQARMDLHEKKKTKADTDRLIRTAEGQLQQCNDRVEEIASSF